MFLSSETVHRRTYLHVTVVVFTVSLSLFPCLLCRPFHSPSLCFPVYYSPPSSHQLSVSLFIVSTPSLPSLCFPVYTPPPPTSPLLCLLCPPPPIHITPICFLFIVSPPTLHALLCLLCPPPPLHHLSVSQFIVSPPLHSPICFPDYCVPLHCLLCPPPSPPYLFPC